MYSRGTRYLFLVLSAALGLLALSGRALAASETVNVKDNNSSVLQTQSAETKEQTSTYTVDAKSSQNTIVKGGGTNTDSHSNDNVEQITDTARTNLVDSSGESSREVDQAAQPVIANLPTPAEGASVKTGTNTQVANHAPLFAAPNVAPSDQVGSGITAAQSPVPVKTPVHQPLDLGYTLGALAQLLGSATIAHTQTDFMAAISHSQIAGNGFLVAWVSMLALMTLIVMSGLILQWRKKGFVHAARADLVNQKASIRKLVGGLLKSNSYGASSHFISSIPLLLQNQKSKIMCNTNLIGGAL